MRGRAVWRQALMVALAGGAAAGGAGAMPGPAAAAPVIRALFVGIDRYAYSRTHNDGGDFDDLEGAVADAMHIKAALRDAYRLALDEPRAASCESSNRVSTTLTNGCATRAKILAALAGRIDASAPGDTVIFYFAGHGSQFDDDQIGDQAARKNGTIMPSDARQPGAPTDGDILDRELKGYIDGATARGVNIVTIFDSCDSGTATRGATPAAGRARSAPVLTVHGPVVRPVPPPAIGPGGGYRVHLAAAADDEEAREIGGAAKSAGVFTSALAQVIRQMPRATFDDIARETRLLVAQTGHAAQHPQAEGALTQTLAGGLGSVALFDAAPRGDAFMLRAGRLSGVTVGSRYALFATSTAAQTDGTPPLARATVTNVDNSTALMTLDALPVAALPLMLRARETSHAAGADRLTVRNDVVDAAGHRHVEAALAALAFVSPGDAAMLTVSTRFSSPTAKLFSADGTEIAVLGAIDDGFDDRLRGALEAVARGRSLLALASGQGPGDASFCIDNQLDYDPRACPGGPARHTARLRTGAPARLSVINTAGVDRYVYVYVVDDRFGIALVLPSGGGIDPALAPGQALATQFPIGRSGLYRFVTIAADAPIDAGALEQAAGGAGRCGADRAQPLCVFNSGLRDGAAQPVTAWTATIAEAVVAPCAAVIRVTPLGAVPPPNRACPTR